MIYNLYDNGVCIAFVLDGNTVLIHKTAIKNVSVIRDSIIKIQLDCCMNNIFISFKDVISPPSTSADIMLNQINSWIYSNNAPFEPGR